MKVNPYVMFNGQCKEAFQFYERVLRGKILFMMTYGESPAKDQMPPATHNLVIHATLSLDDQLIMASDTPPDRYEKPQGLYISLHFTDVGEGEKVFKALSEDGNVQMPFEKTFWADRFGMCVDRFGIPWMVNCETPK
jgi:PhnB protein